MDAGEPPFLLPTFDFLSKVLFQRVDKGNVDWLSH
jgi:hypothetical protein